jgi:hypothetical protein
MRLPVTLSVRRSRTLIVALAAAHLLAAAGLVATDLPVVARLLLLPILGLSLMRTLRRGNVSALTLGADGHLTLVGPDGSATACEVDRATTVFRWLIVLQATTHEGPESLTLPVDALGVEGHRQLRLWLKWKASVSAV